jgi:hypothetical protein
LADKAAPATAKPSMDAPTSLWHGWQGLADKAAPATAKPSMADGMVVD